MSVWYCNSGILVHVLCNAEKEFGEYGGLVHMADVKDQWISNRTSSKISRGKLRNCPFLDPVGKGNPGCANWAAMAFQKSIH